MATVSANTALTLTAEHKKKIVEALNERGAKLPCARCGNNDFTLLDRLTAISLGDGRSVTLGGQVIPAALVACTKCGAIYQHAVGVLGLFQDFGF